MTDTESILSDQIVSLIKKCERLHEELNKIRSEHPEPVSNSNEEERLLEEIRKINDQIEKKNEEYDKLYEDYDQLQGNLHYLKEQKKKKVAEATARWRENDKKMRWYERRIKRSEGEVASLKQEKEAQKKRIEELERRLSEMGNQKKRAEDWVARYQEEERVAATTAKRAATAEQREESSTIRKLRENNRDLESKIRAKLGELLSSDHTVKKADTTIQQLTEENEKLKSQLHDEGGEMALGMARSQEMLINRLVLVLAELRVEDHKKFTQFVQKFGEEWKKSAGKLEQIQDFFSLDQVKTPMYLAVPGIWMSLHKDIIEKDGGVYPVSKIDETIESFIRLQRDRSIGSGSSNQNKVKREGEERK